MAIADTQMLLSWAIVYYVRLVLGSEKCKLQVKFSRHSKPNVKTEVKLLEDPMVNFCSKV